MPDSFTPIPDDTLDELRWLANSQYAIAIVDKPVLRVLLDAYERDARVMEARWIADRQTAGSTEGGE